MCYNVLIIWYNFFYFYTVVKSKVKFKNVNINSYITSNYLYEFLFPLKFLSMASVILDNNFLKHFIDKYI